MSSAAVSSCLFGFAGKKGRLKDSGQPHNESSHSTTGRVTMLSIVLIKVALETISGFVSNCTAIKVVFAAVGMAAANTMICLTSPSTGRISANPKAMSGDTNNFSKSE